MFRKPQYRKFSVHLCNENSLTIRKEGKRKLSFFMFEYQSSLKNIWKIEKR